MGNYPVHVRISLIPSDHTSQKLITIQILNCLDVSFNLMPVSNEGLKVIPQMNPEGPLVLQSNIQIEFNNQIVGLKGVWINSPQKKLDCLRSFFTQCFCLRSIA